MTTYAKFSHSLLTFLFISLLFFTFCSKRPDQPEQVIIAQVADRAISLDEFIKRSEYTIRPPYARGDHYIHKKIVLNSIIAEKLMAIEGGEDNELAARPEFQRYIQGRREQAMRKWLFHNEGTKKIKLSDAQVANAYRWAGRTYDVAYFTVATKDQADSVSALFNDPSVSFADVFSDIGGEGELPTREVKWQREGSDAIMDALYSDSLRIGQVIGPVKVEENVYTAIKILGWTESVAISEEQIRLRLNDVKERLARTNALKIYTEFVQDVMRGKEVEFDERTFYKVVDIVKPFYVISEEDKRATLNAQFWQEEDTTRINYEAMANDFEDIKDWPMLTIEGETWTVERLRNEIGRHPLVFRNRNLTDQNFAKNFMLAVVDLIRDTYLTEEAYKRGYDKVNVIEQYTNMFRDQALALYHQQDYLRSQGCELNFNKDYMKIIDDYLNSYVDSLQAKYSDRIFIDTDILENVELTRIDMFVLEKNVPYPTAVPNFPILTTDNRLDYGQLMQKQD
ncbi:hypothetical protein EH223_10505 [candidate division KSB1 bacterium]|nr:hypothetical protein [candidate division KSB1 bacterium]RQW03188.1 MAG: hypothetical protein EH223_10505 [candidate division KSB1 bacterium]